MQPEMLVGVHLAEKPVHLSGVKLKYRMSTHLLKFPQCLLLFIFQNTTEDVTDLARIMLLIALM